MRAIRSLAALALAASLLAIPALTSAQSGTAAGDPALPLARQPGGQLPLEGTPWRLVAYRWKGTERGPGPEVAAAMTLAAGKLEASGGCTAFRGAYGTTGSAIDFDLKRVKKNECAEQTTMVQLAMVAGLRKAARYEIAGGVDGDELALFNAAGAEVLRFAFDDVSWLTTSTWALEAYARDGKRQTTDTGTLRFVSERTALAKRREEGTVVGGTGCNGFTGEFYRHAGVLSFGALTDTGAPCTESLQRQEDAVFAVLDSTAVAVELPADRLILTSMDTGDVLEFRAEAPLEGTTWVLRPASGQREQAEVVTMRLEGGTASGDGPCGAYAADYVTDGFFITFSGVTGASDDACTQAAAQASTLAGLRATVRVDRDPGTARPLPQITLLDAQGRRTLAFEAPYSLGP